MLTEEDHIIRSHILKLMCHFETSRLDDTMKLSDLPDVLIRLKEMETDGLIEIQSD